MKNVHYTFRHVEATEAIKAHIEKHVDKLDKYVPYPIDIHITVDVEKGGRHMAEITLRAEHQELFADAVTNDLYASIELVASKLEAQLKKEREKRKGHQSAHQVSRTSGPKLGTDVEGELPHQIKRVNNNNK